MLRLIFLMTSIVQYITPLINTIFMFVEAIEESYLIKNIFKHKKVLIISILKRETNILFSRSGNLSE